MGVCFFFRKIEGEYCFLFMYLRLNNDNNKNNINNNNNNNNNNSYNNYK